MTRCSFCFQERQSLRIVMPNTQPVCNGCARSIDGTIGWLTFQGARNERDGLPEPTHYEVGGAPVSPPTPQTVPNNDAEVRLAAEVAPDTTKPRK